MNELERCQLRPIDRSRRERSRIMFVKVACEAYRE